MEFTCDLCVSMMPELSGMDLDIEELRGGITNKLYRVKSSDGRDYVFRIYGQKTELFINRDVEMENLRRMERLKVTQKLIKYLPEQHMTIVQFIPGYVLKNQDFEKEELWESIVRPIKIIHKSGINLPHIFNPLQEVNRLYNILQGLDTNYPEFDISGTIAVLKKINDIVNFPHSKYVPCHNDLLADNFILTEDKQRFKEPMYLIDWEYGGMSPAYYDFADMFQEILVPKDIERSLLEIYFENKDMNYQVYMIDLFKPFPDMYWFLWSMIQLNISNIQFDYYNYGRVKYENAQKNMADLRDRYGLGIDIFPHLP